MTVIGFIQWVAFLWIYNGLKTVVETRWPEGFAARGLAVVG